MGEAKVNGPRELDTNTADIVIVGGGLVGLTCSQMLSRAMPTAKIRLIEKYPIVAGKPASSSFDSRSTALSLGSVTLLQALGAWQYIHKNASPILEVQVSDRGHFGKVSYQENKHNPQPLGFVVDNASLGNALTITSACENLEILAPATVDKVVPRKNAVEIHSNTCPPITASLLIIADGAESALRHQLGIGARIDEYAQHAVIANVVFEKKHGGQAFERFTSEGPMALLPLLDEEEPGHTAALVWTRPSHQLQDCLSWSDEEFLAKLQQYFSYPLGRFTRVGKRAHYPLKRILAEEQVRSNIVLLGNAAHFLHPVAGQGFNLALRDAMQLVDTLSEANRQNLGCGDLSVLQKYLDKQRIDQSATSLISHSFNRVFSNEKPKLQLARNLGLLSLDLLPFAKKKFFSHMMGRGQRQVQPHFMRESTWGSQSFE